MKYSSGIFHLSRSPGIHRKYRSWLHPLHFRPRLEMAPLKFFRYGLKNPTPKILAPLSGTSRSYPPQSQAWELVSLSLTYPTTFADVGETSPTRKWFRAFIEIQFQHVVPPFLEKLSAANIQCFADNVSLRQCSMARPSLQSPVVRSERSSTDELLRFAFATTC